MSRSIEEVIYEGPYEFYQWHPVGAVSKITLWNMRVKGGANEDRGWLAMT